MREKGRRGRERGRRRGGDTCTLGCDISLSSGAEEYQNSGARDNELQRNVYPTTLSNL